MTYPTSPSLNRHPSPIRSPAAAPVPPRLSGAKSHIFQPPRSTSYSTSASASSSLILTRSTSTSTSHAPRKRSRPDDGDTDRDRDERCRSPMPLVNTKYVLAGGMDTPTMKAAELAVGGEDDQGYRNSGDDNTRRGLFTEMEGSGYFPQDGRMGNGRPIGWRSPRSEREGWVGLKGVVGKIWEWGGAVFRGFHAGGGQGYTLNDPSSASASYEVQSSTVESSYWETENFTSNWDDRESTPVPGRFPDEDLIPDYLDRACTPERPSKRRQVSRNNTAEEIARNWVVVQPITKKVETPTRPQPRPRPAAAARYSNPTASSAGRLSSTPRPASRASLTPRRPLISRASHAPLHSPSHSSKIPRPASPSPKKNVESPAAKEALKWKAVKKREEREADESIRRLDRQLKAMIREGKEALGSRVSVEFEGDGGGRKWDF